MLALGLNYISASEEKFNEMAPSAPKISLRIKVAITIAIKQIPSSIKCQ